MRCRNPDPDIQEDTFWGNQNRQLKAEDSNRRQGKLPELGRGNNTKESTLYASENPLNEKYCETEQKVPNYRTENRLKHL